MATTKNNGTAMHLKIQISMSLGTLRRGMHPMTTSMYQKILGWSTFGVSLTLWGRLESESFGSFSTYFVAVGTVTQEKRA